MVSFQVVMDGPYSESHTLVLYKITVSHKKDIQIYLPQGEVGPRNDQYRDCVDLSAKIAFGLNKMDNWSKLDLKKIKDWDVIKELSNNKKIDASIIALDLPIRIKQTSDTNTIHKFNIIGKTVDKILTVVESFNSEMREDLQYTFCCLLRDVVDASSFPLLAHHHETCVEKLLVGLNTESRELIELIGGVVYETER